MNEDGYERELRSMSPIRWRDVRPVAKWIGGVISTLVVVLVGALAADWIARRDLMTEQAQALIAIREKDQSQDAEMRRAARDRIEMGKLLERLNAITEQLERRIDRHDKLFDGAPKWVFPTERKEQQR